MARIKKKVVIEEVNICDYCKEECEIFGEIGLSYGGENNKYELCRICSYNLNSQLSADSKKIDEHLMDIAKQSRKTPPKGGKKVTRKKVAKKTSKKTSAGGKKRGRSPKKKENHKSSSSEPEREALPDDTKVRQKIIINDRGEEQVVNEVVPGKALSTIMREAHSVTAQELSESNAYDPIRAKEQGSQMVYDEKLGAWRFASDITSSDVKEKMKRNRDQQRDAVKEKYSQFGNESFKLKPEG